jgi:hypothetical protein
MRSQLNELVELAVDLKSLIVDHTSILEPHISVSDNIKISRASSSDYMGVSFNPFPNKVEVTVYESENFKQNTVIIDTFRVSDEDLDAIILRSKEEIAIFKRLFEKQIVAKRRMKILELQNELDKLNTDYNVHTSKFGV